MKIFIVVLCIRLAIAGAIYWWSYSNWLIVLLMPVLFPEMLPFFLISYETNKVVFWPVFSILFLMVTYGLSLAVKRAEETRMNDKIVTRLGLWNRL
jgi:hypothetical protein